MNFSSSCGFIRRLYFSITVSRLLRGALLGWLLWAITMFLKKSFVAFESRYGLQGGLNGLSNGSLSVVFCFTSFSCDLGLFTGSLPFLFKLFLELDLILYLPLKLVVVLNLLFKVDPHLSASVESFCSILACFD